MLKYKNKKAAKLLSLAIALECVGGTMMPVVVNAHSAAGISRDNEPLATTTNGANVTETTTCTTDDCEKLNYLEPLKEGEAEWGRNIPPEAIKEYTYNGYKYKIYDTCYTVEGDPNGEICYERKEGQEDPLPQTVGDLKGIAKKRIDRINEAEETVKEGNYTYIINNETGCYSLKGDNNKKCDISNTNAAALLEEIKKDANVRTKTAAYNSAKNSEENLKQTIGNIIELKDEDDDLQYVNKVLQLMTDSSGKQQPSEILKSYIESAEKDKAESEKAGTPINKTTQAILDMSDRLTKIAENATSDTETYPSAMKTNDIKIYTQALAEFKSCNAKNALNESKGEKTETCAFTDEQQAAMNRLISNNAIIEAVKKSTQQTNQTSSDAKTTNATSTTGSSSEKSETK